MALALVLMLAAGPGLVVERCKLVRTECKWELVSERPLDDSEDRDKIQMLEGDASNPDRCRAGHGEPSDYHEASEGSTHGVLLLLRLPFDRGRARTGQDYRTGPIVLQSAHRLSEHRGRSREQTNSWLGSRSVDYQPWAPIVHRHALGQGQGQELGDEAPGRSLPAPIPRRSPRFRDRTAVVLRAPVDVVDVLIAPAVLHAGMLGDVMDLVEELQGLQDDVDWRFVVEMLIPKALSHRDICGSNCLPQLDLMVQSSCGSRLPMLVTADEFQYRSNPLRQCKIVRIRNESDRSYARWKYDRQ